MKKILMIGHLDYRFPGGIETKAKNIIRALKGNQISFVATVKPPRNSKQIDKIVDDVCVIDATPKSNTYPFKPIKTIKMLLKQDGDLIIGMSPANSRIKKLFKDNRVVYVQSMDVHNTDFMNLKLSEKIKLKLDQVFLGTYYSKNPARESKNVVFFTDFHVKNPNTIENKFSIPNPFGRHIKYIENKKRSGAFFAGRIDYGHKGLDFMKGIDIDIYGIGPDEDKAKVDFEKRFLGGFSSLDFPKIAKKYKAFVSTSRTEGFQNTICESLGSGVPVVMFDGLDQAGLFGQCKAVKIVEFGNIEKLNDEISKLNKMPNEEWEKLSHEAVVFAKENLSIDKFEKNGKEVLEIMTKK